MSRLTRTTPIARTAAVTTALALALAACGGASTGTSAGSQADSSSPAPAQTGSSATDVASDAASGGATAADSATAAGRGDDAAERAIPAGYREVDAPITGVEFAVPGNWASVDSDDDFDDDDDDDDYAEVARARGTTTDVIRTTMEGLDLYGLSWDEDESGFLENVQVRLNHSSDEPDEQALRQHVDSINGTPGAYTTTQTAAGTVHQIQYTLTDPHTPGDIVGHCATIAVRADDGTWSAITVATGSDARTLELAEVITSTLHLDG